MSFEEYQQAMKDEENGEKPLLTISIIAGDGQEGSGEGGDGGDMSSEMGMSPEDHAKHMSMMK